MTRQVSIAKGQDGLGRPIWTLTIPPAASEAEAFALAEAIRSVPSAVAFVPTNPDPFAASAIADEPPERMPYVVPPRDPMQDDDTGEEYTIPGCATGACGLD